MRYSLLFPLAPARPEQAVPFANLVRWTGAHRLWQGQTMTIEAHQLITWLAGIGIRVPAGFGVSLMPFRSPYQAALDARSVAISTGQPVLAGFGPGEPVVQESMLGSRYSSPLRASEEYVRIVRGLLSGQPTEVGGEHYSTYARLGPCPSAPVSVGLGVLREKMAVLAGEVADAAITWLGSASYLDRILLPAMRAAPDRALPEPVRVTAFVPVALAGVDRDVTDLAAASCGAHLRAPHYQDALRRSGIELSGDGSDFGKLVDAGVFLYGTAADIHERLDEYRTIGVDEIVLNVSGVAKTLGFRAAIGDLEEILAECPNTHLHPMPRSLR
ncbi:LLM class flavin-dependent oxidoreductase [Amycolatopsis minnesotensis]|uniref:5,10-methylenetetrahydromethanopterin reductase n=1 Tax=Amycolatopsis minnesotensis TaxID=337894 RepID=A0ABN2QQW7_9PSEU